MDVTDVALVVAVGCLLSERGAGEEAKDGAALEVGLGKELLGAALWKRPLKKMYLAVVDAMVLLKTNYMLLLLNFSLCAHSLINEVLQIVVWKHFNKSWNFSIKTMEKSCHFLFKILSNSRTNQEQLHLFIIIIHRLGSLSQIL
jgi:hypothetical protein